MSHTPRAPRAVAQRRTIGRRLRAHRLALGLTNQDLADHTGCGTYQVTSIESVCRDVLLGTAIDLAAALGLEVALVADYHLPLLDLTADEVAAVVAAALGWAGEIGPDPHPLHMRSGLRKLTTSTEEADHA